MNQLDTPRVADRSIASLATWLGRYAARRWLALAAVMTTMVVNIALDVLRPWPMKVLVDHALGGQPVAAPLATIMEALPGGSS